MLYATLIGEGEPDLIEACAWLQRAADGSEEVEQALHRVVDQLSLDEFAKARRRYLELAQGR